MTLPAINIYIQNTIARCCRDENKTVSDSTFEEFTTKIPGCWRPRSHRSQLEGLIYRAGLGGSSCSSPSKSLTLQPLLPHIFGWSRVRLWGGGGGEGSDGVCCVCVCVCVVRHCKRSQHICVCVCVCVCACVHAFGGGGRW